MHQLLPLIREPTIHKLWMVEPSFRVLDILVQTAIDPSILGMASHLLYIGQHIALPQA